MSYSLEINNEEEVTFENNILFAQKLWILQYSEIIRDGIHHVVGFNYKYQFCSNNNFLMLDYYISPGWYVNFHSGEVIGIVCAGLNFGYSINKKDFSISPQLCFIYTSFGIFFVTFEYRFNNFINMPNSHEIGIKVGVNDFRVTFRK